MEGHSFGWLTDIANKYDTGQKLAKMEHNEREQVSIQEFFGGGDAYNLL